MTEIALPVTSLLAGALAVWLLVLSWAVIQVRQGAGVSLGDGGDLRLQRRTRAQGNLVEYAPLFLILLALAELQGAAGWLLSLLALVFLAARLAHGYAFAFTSGWPLGRMAGTGLTFASLAVAAATVLGAALF
ncbi:MAG: MAPEG family protein [Pseudomonadota bacterium]